MAPCQTVCRPTAPARAAGPCLVPGARLLSTEPTPRSGTRSGCGQLPQAELSALPGQSGRAGRLGKELERSTAHTKGGHCFPKLVSDICSVYAVLHCTVVSLLWTLPRNIGVPLFLLNKLYFISIMKFYAALTMNNPELQAKTTMNLKNIILNRKRQVMEKTL